MIPGTIPITAPVAPTVTNDTYPSHLASYGKGGFRTVATITDRDNIPSLRREAYMKVVVAASGNVYTLQNDLTTWVLDTNPSSIDLNGYQQINEKGQADGYCDLDSSGFVPTSRLNFSPLQWQGTWNATTNTPTLSDATGTNGYMYRVSVAGTQDLGSGSISFSVGDWIAHNGTIWQKNSDNSAVGSVFGRTGIIQAISGDYSADLIDFTPSSVIITATNVQSAIDELETYVNGLGVLAISGVYTINDISTDTTLTSSHKQVSITSAGIIITLPSASTYPIGQPLIIKDESGDAGDTVINFVCQGADTLQGETDGALISSAYGYVWLYTKGGTTWYILTSK